MSVKTFQRFPSTASISFLLLVVCFFLVFSLEIFALEVAPRSKSKLSDNPVVESVVDVDNMLEITKSDGTVTRRRVDPNGSMMVYCYGEFDLCRNYPRQTTADMWNCLYKQAHKIKNKKCFDFVTGLQLCAKDVHATDDCAIRMPEWSLAIRYCMHEKAPETVSEACRATAYYKHCRKDLPDATEKA